jgi:catechol 2,3-dioxygenase-like lactoylglutathione lyase family enzyme
MRLPLMRLPAPRAACITSMDDERDDGLRVVSAPLDTMECSTRNLVAPASSSSSSNSSACCLLLLAFASTPSAPVGSLRLCPAGAFAARISHLRLPPEGSGLRKRVASELLWHAVRHDPLLRSGGALLARARHADEEGCQLLSSVGFAPTSAGIDQGEGSRPPLLALVRRRDPSEPPADASHAAISVSDIERSVEFWSLLHFRPTRLFTTEGARACWLSAPWTSLSLELIEIPPLVLKAARDCAASGGPCRPDAAAAPAAPLTASSAAPSATSATAEDDELATVGLAHVCVDVTPLGVSLPSTLELLRHQSSQRFGRPLRLLSPARQQMMADLVVEVAVLRAPDGVRLELVHRASTLSRSPDPDWSL